MTTSRIGLLALALAFGMAGAAAAEDLQLTKADTTELTQGNVGKPFWSLQAQCAGIYGAGYRYEADRQRTHAADSDEAWGVSMLNAALARLQTDRSIDQKAAMDLASPEVEYGRNMANDALKSGGTNPNGQWNYLRSACEDIAAAYEKAQRR